MGGAFLGYLGIERLHAGWTNAMAKIRVGVLSDVGLNLVPIAFVVAYLLAGGADGQKAAERLYPG